MHGSDIDMHVKILHFLTFHMCQKINMHGLLPLSFHILDVVYVCCSH